MDILRQYLTLMLPLLLIQLVVQVAACGSILRSPKVKGGSKIIWLVIVAAGGILGALLYFVLGRVEDENP